MSQFKKLFEPGKIGRLETKNRLVMAPMGTHSCDEEGFITDKALRYYAARANGGVGLVIVQSIVMSKGSATPRGMRLYDDKYIPGMEKLTQIIHQGGAKAIAQINHHGAVFAAIRKASLGLEQVEVIGPSAIPSLFNGVVPREMSKQDIRSFVDAFAETCRRARDAGFDGVEIHGAHGYVLHSFLSPLTNRRNDEYGGDTTNRARLVCEVLRAARRRVGPDFAIILRVSGTELLEGGIRIEDVALQAPLFVDAGADAIHVSACTSDYTVLALPSYLESEAPMVPLAAAVKKVVKVPVIAVGRLGDPVLAERVLQEGKADFIALGRALLADPDLPNKAKEGRLQDINYCISCNNCFLMLSAGGKISDFTCMVNPGLLAEADGEQKLAGSPKKVMVIGGGPAGMMAARDLAQRGHKVSLYEKDGRLGGQWNIVCMEEHKAGFARFLDYMERGIKKAGVNVVLNQVVTPEVVREAQPEAVVVATGASPAKLDVPGIDGRNVVQAVDVITGKARVGNSVVVLSGCNRPACRGLGCGAGAGGCQVGMETAVSLAKQGKKVTLTARRELGRGVEKCIFIHLRNELFEMGVQMVLHSPVSEIRETGVYVTYQGLPLFLKADTVVLAVGSRPENKLAEQLKGMAPEIYTIGDCVEPRTAIYATQEAAHIARQV